MARNLLQIPASTNGLQEDQRLLIEKVKCGEATANSNVEQLKVASMEAQKCKKFNLELPEILAKVSQISGKSLA